MTTKFQSAIVMIGDTIYFCERTVEIMLDIRQNNFRINQESADTFRKYCEENGFSQAEGFDTLIKLAELDKAKTAMPGRAVEIEGFEKLMKDVLSAYLYSLEVYNTTEERIREKFSDTLNSKEKTISDYQKKEAELQESKAAAEATAQASAQAAAQAIKDMETAKEQAETSNKLAEERSRTIASLADKLAITEEKAAGYDDLKSSEEQKQREIEKLQAEIASNKTTYDREIDELKKEHDRKIDDLNKSHQSEVKDLQTELATTKKDNESALKDLQNETERKISDKDKEIEALSKDHETAIRELKNEMERKVSDEKKDAALSLTQAVADKERELTGQIRDLEKENAKLLTKIELLEERIKELTTTPQQ